MAMSKVDIINNTVEYYTKNPRAYDSDLGFCFYLTADDRRCAVGRFSVSGKLDQFDGGISEFLGDYHIGSIDEVLDPSVHGHSVEFWSDLQVLHDRGEFWSSKGLTEEGKKYRDRLLRRYGPET